MPAPTGDIPINAGELDSFTTDWYVSSEGDDTVSTVSEISKLSNNGLRVTSPIHASLLFRTSGGWTWQENGGIVDGEDGETIIPAGETVEVTYNLQGSTWKSKVSNWQYTGTLQDADDVRALGFKIYAGVGESISGSVTISDFQCNF